MEGFKHYRPTSAGIEHKRRYHVSLSFIGTDVRKGLVDHLFQSLSTAGLHIFVDSERLEKGENIGESLEKAIEDSTLYLPIFSPDYASSAWCLKELLHIWKICRSRSRDRKIIPLFYNMEPSHVRFPEGEKSPYAQAFQKHNEKGKHRKEEMDEWKEALHGVSLLSGWSLRETSDGFHG